MRCSSTNNSRNLIELILSTLSLMNMRESQWDDIFFSNFVEKCVHIVIFLLRDILFPLTIQRPYSVSS